MCTAEILGGSDDSGGSESIPPPPLSLLRTAVARMFLGEGATLRLWRRLSGGRLVEASQSLAKGKALKKDFPHPPPL